jgi:hypothetical protein
MTMLRIELERTYSQEAVEMLEATLQDMDPCPCSEWSIADAVVNDWIYRNDAHSDGVRRLLLEAFYDWHLIDEDKGYAFAAEVLKDYVLEAMPHQKLIADYHGWNDLLKQVDWGMVASHLIEEQIGFLNDGTVDDPNHLWY